MEKQPAHFETQRRRRWPTCLAAIFAVAILGWSLAHVVRAQPVAGFDISDIDAPATATPAADGAVVDAESEKETEVLFPSSAVLKTDPDIERLMRRAQELTDEQRYDVSATLWQQVLDRSGSELTTRADWVDKRDENEEAKWLQTYKSVRTEVERLLAHLPKEGLAQYRIIADAQARTLLAGAIGDREEAALDEIVRRYFVSSVGDDAAYRLGCLLLDRHDFTGAARMFEKIVAIHPDPTMTREEVMLRLAVCQARTGNKISAEQTYAELSKQVAAHPAVVSAEAFQLVGKDIEKPHTLVTDTFRSSGDWPQPFGTPARDGHMPALPAGALAGDLHESWSYRVEAFDSDAYRAALASPAEPDQTALRMRNVYGADMNPGVASVSRDTMIENWKSQDWTPTGQAIISGGKVIFRTPTRIACFDATAVGEARLLWMAPPEGSLTADGKEFEAENIDRLKKESTDWARMSAYLSSRADRPGDYRSVSMFGDRIPQSMAQANDTVYFLDDVPQMRPDTDPATVMRAMASMTGTDESKSLKSRSKMMAIDSNTGKILWEWPGDDASEKPADDFRFLGPPIPRGRQLLVPVYTGGGLWVYAIETAESKNAAGKRVQTRKLAWKTSLCDDPQSGGDRWAPVGMCLDGGDLFVASGRGVVFALDAAAGAIRWAVRYQRTMSASRPTYNNWGGVQSSYTFNGWDENFIVARGPWIVLMASDYRPLVALQRGSGQFAWASVGAEAAHYLLGVVGDRVFVAGPKILKAYSFRSEGSTSWEVAIEDGSYGRGALTADSIYIPVKDRIRRYSLAGKLLGEVNVKFSRDHDEPVGNLFTDGKTLFAVGPERFYALVNIDQQLGRLDAQISAGDTSLLRYRMLLRARKDQLDEALADLRSVQQLLAKTEDPAQVLAFTLASLDEIELAKRAPDKALAALVDANGAVTKLPAADREALRPRQRNQLSTQIAQALERVVAKPQPRYLAIVLASIEQWPDESLRVISDLAVKATAAADNAPLLERSLKSPSARVRAASATALARLQGATRADAMAALLADPSDEVRVAAAHALAEFGDRRALAPLVALLDSSAVNVRYEANRSLMALTGEKFALVAYADAKERAPVVAQWKAWLADKGGTAKLRSPLDFSLPRIGRILVTDFDNGLARDLDDKGNVVWTSPSIPGAFGCQGLPNGHRLITSFQRREVYEFNDKGDEIWRSKALPFYPTAVQRLPNGNTLVAGRGLDEVSGAWVEVGRDGNVLDATSVRLPLRPEDIRLLPDGQILAACTFENMVCRLHRDGRRDAKETITKVVRPEAARMLADGHILVADNGGQTRQVSEQRGGRRVVKTIRPGQVIEFDERFNIVKTTKNENGEVRDAEKLASGNLLILDADSSQELTPTGTQVWSKTIPGGKRMSVY
jgi:outer membrane protein assembly factor BamB